MFSVAMPASASKPDKHALAGVSQLKTLVIRIVGKRGKSALDVGQHHPDVFGELVAYALCGHRQRPQGLSGGAGPMTIQQH